MHRVAGCLALIALLGFGCQTTNEEEHGHSHEAGGHHGNGHAHDAEAVSYTVWTDSLELFVEFAPLVVGQVSSVAAHFTTLADYQPVREGSMTVSLIQGEKGVRQEEEAPSSPGIFNPALKPTQAGPARLIGKARGGKPLRHVPVSLPDIRQ